MRDPFRWSISLGRWGTPTVRLHIFFIIFAASTLFLCWQDSGHPAANLLGTAVIAMVVLLLSVLAHEWSHWLVAHRYAIAPDQLVIGPLGGISEWPNAPTSPGRLAGMAAGPVANLIICLGCIAVLRATAFPTDFLHWFNPLEPAWAVGSPPLGRQTLQLTLWINWLLFVANLLPAFPFDGGHILRAAICAARPNWTCRRVAGIVFWIAVVLSAAIMSIALILLKREVDTVFPTSFALILLAVVLLVSARRDADNLGNPIAPEAEGTEREDPWRRERRAAELEEDDFDQDELDEETFEEGLGAEEEPWVSSPAAEDRQPVPEEIEAMEELLLDPILSRLHSEGLDSLTREERDLLERVSARYRSRLGRRT